MQEIDFTAHARQAAHALGARPELAGVDLIIEQRVMDGDALIANFHMIIRDEQLQVVDGTAADEADVIITQDRETAEGLRTGSLHAQSAYLTGSLTVSGDVSALLAHGETLAEVLRAANA
jgi:putative sterol carrier protein